MMRGDRTLAAILTPAGRGAVAVIAVEGSRAVELLEQFFQPLSASGFSTRSIGRIVYGRWGREGSEDVIVCRRENDCVEVHCHGGNAAARRIVDDLVIAGAMEQPWADWICAHEGSATSARAGIELARAATARTAEILLDQYDGALDRRLREILAKIDKENGGGQTAAEMIDELLVRAPVGLHLTQPWRVVVAGPPNVGKSSLVNALVGYERAIVFDQPGTTRDVVTARTAFSGWPVELSDTAGLRAGADSLETAGVERARQQAGTADCLLLVFDGSQAWGEEQQRLIDAWPSAIVVLNKSDLGGAERGVARGRETVTTSALRGQGIGELMDRIVGSLVPVEPRVGEGVPFTIEQIERLEAAKAALNIDEAFAARGHLLALLAPSDAAAVLDGSDTRRSAD